MRVASSQYHTTIQLALGHNQERFSELTQQMATGRRILRPSDDPIGNVRLARLTREEATLQQYRANIAAVRIRLDRNEDFLSNMIGDIGQGRDMLVWAADGGNAPADLNALVTPLTTLRDSLRHTANAKDQEGHYMFSGTLATTAPIAFNAAAPAGSRYTYAGNTAAQPVLVGNGITQVANENVGGIEQLLNQLDLAIDVLGAPGADANLPATRTVLANALDCFDSARDLLAGKIAVFGGAQNILSALDDNHANVSLSNQMAQHELGSLDYGQAATLLNGYASAIQATYKAYSKISTLSLFDRM